MHRRDDQVELGQTVVREVQGAVRPNVALDARQQCQAFQSIADLADPTCMSKRPPLVQTVGHRE